MTISPIV